MMFSFVGLLGNGRSVRVVNELSRTEEFVTTKNSGISKIANMVK